MRYALVLGAMDLVSIGMAFSIVAQVHGGEAPFFSAFQEYEGYLFLFLLLWPLLAFQCRLFFSRRRDDLLSLFFDAVKCVALTIVGVGFGMAFFFERTDSSFLSQFGLVSILTINGLRIVLQILLWSFRRRGINERQILVVGCNDRSRHLVEIIGMNPHYGYRPIGFIEDEEERRSLLEVTGLPCLGGFDDVQDVLHDNIVDEVYVCLPVRSRYEVIQRTALICEEVGVPVRMVADLFPLRLATSRFHNLEDIPILALSTVPENQPQLLLQRTLDVLVSASLLVLLSPVFLLAAIAIKLDSPGPVFFAQDRVGLNMRPFKMHKFRSMVANAAQLQKELEHQNEAEGAFFKIKRDPRITRTGRILRRFSIDELPQLFNVLVGDMTLVGPRPHPPRDVEKYTWAQRRRLSVKPGMTGLSQVSGRSELSFDDTVYLDLYYIDQWSIALVIRVLFLTLPAVLKGRGAF